MLFLAVLAQFITQHHICSIMVSQQARQYYLQALGLDSYVPRHALPGAAPSSFFDTDESSVGQFEELPEAHEDTYENAIVEHKNAEQKHQRAPGLAKISLNLAPNKKIASEPESEQSDGFISELNKTSQPAVHRFSLAVWRLNSRLMIIDSRNPRLALPTTQLLKNILLAINFREELPAFESIRWPLASDQNRSNNTNEQEARNFLQAFLQAQYEKRPSETVLLMGAHAARYALSSEQWGNASLDPNKEAALLGQQFKLISDQTAIVVPSLAAMLKMPQLKAITWRAIKHLQN